jgi:hypothetical protein
MTVQIPRNDTVKNYQDWIVIAVKTNPKLTTYSFIAISPQDELYHIDQDELESVEAAISVGQRFVDLEEQRNISRGFK